ncbi:MAG: UDP-glucose/GDP-mannose dehydrogenase family protein [Marinobacterium sp.]|nr:UDP-glucose/GDP-mannose dehydrogenase family protein [Marinobacterium sp.]
MKISIWGRELSAWVAGAALARAGNHIAFCSLGEQALADDLIVQSEPGLKELLLSQYNAGRIQFLEHDSFCSDCYENEVHWLAYGAGEYDQAVYLVQKLARTHTGQLLLINQSYFNLGATESLASYLDSKCGQFIACLPSTLSEGSALNDFLSPASFIAGCDQSQAFSHIRALLRPFMNNIKELQLMSAREAEFTKFAINGMLALRLGYINEMANLADSINVDIERVRDAMISDYRIGPHHLSPGCGFGGSVFSIYIRGLIEAFQHRQLPSILNTLIDENERQKELPFRKLWQHFACDVRGKTFTIWGASFKPLTANISNAPALKIIDALLAQGCSVRVHDPAALENLKSYYDCNKRGKVESLELCVDMYEALNNSSGLILATEWKQYFSPDYKELRKRMVVPLIIDGRNIYDREYLQDTGFIYYGVGR